MSRAFLTNQAYGSTTLEIPGLANETKKYWTQNLEISEFKIIAVNKNEFVSKVKNLNLLL